MVGRHNISYVIGNQPAFFAEQNSGCMFHPSTGPAHLQVFLLPILPYRLQPVVNQIGYHHQTCDVRFTEKYSSRCNAYVCSACDGEFFCQYGQFFLLFFSPFTLKLFETLVISDHSFRSSLKAKVVKI